MAREERAATFIRHFMPQNNRGSLTDQQAFDLSAFVNSHARPDSPGKEGDWPNGGAPYDVPYATKGHVAYRPPSAKLYARPDAAASIVAPPASLMKRSAAAVKAKGSDAAATGGTR
jgi:thiosulfate dehydrogenase